MVKLQIIKWLFNSHRRIFNWLAKVVLSEPKRRKPDKEVGSGNKGVFKKGVDKPGKERPS